MKWLQWERIAALTLVSAIVISVVSGFTAFAKECDGIRSEVLRLHILANSDSAEDQALKLRVRDDLLAHSSELFDGASDKQAAMAKMKAELPEIIRIAQDEVDASGYDYIVNAELVNMYFTTRVYGDVTMPAGMYDALRITIGSGKGHNWWCVMFPPLCLPAAQSKQTFEDALGPNRASLVESGSKPQVKIKFKVVELYEGAANTVRGWFSGKNAKKTATSGAAAK